MNPYLKITITTFTIWLLTAIINGILIGIFISIARNKPTDLAFYIVVIFLVSLFLSVPGFLIFWISLFICFANSIEQRALFRTALSTGLVLAAVTALICSGMFSYGFSSNRYLPSLFIILSATTSIMMHFKHFKKIKTKIQ